MSCVVVKDEALRRIRRFTTSPLFFRFRFCALLDFLARVPIGQLAKTIPVHPLHVVCEVSADLKLFAAKVA